MQKRYLLMVFVLTLACVTLGDGVIPFLAITGKPTEYEIRKKVATMAEQGMESFFIYARSGLEIEYMGEEWLRLNEIFCDEATRRGMKVWLYDEYNWPSGTCKGRVPQENEAWRYRELGVFDDGKGGYEWHEGYAPAGWVNVCEPEAVARFIELTHRVYERRLAKYFKNGTIVGIFTDEPGHGVETSFPKKNPIVKFRNYSGLEQEYLAKTGRKLRTDVEASLRDKRRNEVWPIYSELLGKRFRRAYFDQLRAWCDEMGVKLTGHMIGENLLAYSARSNGMPLTCLRGETLPGMDEIRTAYDPEGKLTHPIEWITFNIARQAILHRGNQGGLAELFACGPADLTPSILRQLYWMAAFHGIDHYLTCMDVMDEKGLVEKHGYLAPAGPIHPWYESHARVLVDEAKIAAKWARKTVSEGEVAARYPNGLSALAAFAGQKEPRLLKLLKELELHQFTCRLLENGEKSDLPLVFSCLADGTFSEENTGKIGLSEIDARKLCEKELKRSFVVLERDGSLAENVLVRTYSDGSSAVINMCPKCDRTLLAARISQKQVFDLPSFGIKTFEATAMPAMDYSKFETIPIDYAKWRLSLDRQNLKRVNFDTNRVGKVAFADGVEKIVPVLRNCAISYAVTGSGRPIGVNEKAPEGVKVFRHLAEPYSFTIDGGKVEPTLSCNTLPSVFASLYREGSPRNMTVGEHEFKILTGEADQNYFFPAMLLAGDFIVKDGKIAPRKNHGFNLGSLAAAGLPDYIGKATWCAKVTAPRQMGLKLQLDTALRVTQVKFCGVDLGLKAWAPYVWEVPKTLQGKTGELEISIWTSAQPMFGDDKNGVWDTRFWFKPRAPNSLAGLYSVNWLLGN